MDTLQHLLKKTVRKFGLQSDVSAAAVFLLTERWLAQEQLPAEQYECIEFSRGTLQIACIHSIAAQELHIRRESLQQYLKMHTVEQPDIAVQILRSRKIGKNA